MLRRTFRRMNVVPGNIEWSRHHHLFSSQPMGTPYMTACGRSFDPQLYHETMNALSDQRWVVALQRKMREDAEYVTMLRTEGGAGLALDALAHTQVQNEEEAYWAMRKVLETDRKAALASCAMQDAFKKIKQNRDVGKTQIASMDGGAGTVRGMQQRMQQPFGNTNMPM
eukprot:PhM_4_TR13498/c0_g1_i1/m.72950